MLLGRTGSTRKGEMKMRSKLQYHIIKDEENRVVSKGFEFIVSQCKTEEEHERAIVSLSNLLDENEIENGIYGEGQFGDENYMYLDIPVESDYQKAQIKNIYKEWKLANK